MSSQVKGGDDPQTHVLEIAGNAIMGGMEKYVYNLAQHLPGLGFNVTCVTPYESAYTASLRQLGCPVYVTAMDFDPPWRSIQFVTELVRHQRIDLIHAHLSRAHVLAGLSGRLMGIPVVYTVHGMDVMPYDLGVARSTGTHLTVVCHAAYAQALALGMPTERVTMIPNGVDMRVYRPNRSGSGFRKSVGIPQNVPLVGFVGRLAWEKGPDLFVQMAGRVHKRHPEVHFVLVGDGPMTLDLREIISLNGLTGQVHLAGIWENMAEVYPAFDILALTSRVEGMPFALLEGMACGCPAVAMAAGGVAEILEVGTTGYLSAIGDWAGLGDALARLIEEKNLREAMGHAARKRVEELFDLQKMVGRMGSLFRNLVVEDARLDARLSTPEEQVGGSLALQAASMQNASNPGGALPGSSEDLNNGW